MSLNIKIPINKLTNGTIMEIVHDLANGRDYPEYSKWEENKFEIERKKDINKYYENGKKEEENEQLNKKWKQIEQSLEYNQEELRVKEINDLRWEEYMDNLIDWLIVNNYTEM